MTELLAFLKQMISAPGLSGYEAPIRELILETWRPLTDDLQVSRLGSLHGLKRGAGSDPRPSILLAAHMDAIGMMVTGIVDGWLHFTQIGGLDPRVLPGQPVIVHGRTALPGVIVQPPSHVLPAEYADRPVPLQHLLVDTGLAPREVERLVRVGDLISYAQAPIEMSGETLVGHSLDNRASVAAVTRCLEELKTRKTLWDVWAVATVQEEETFGGAMTSPFELRPSLAVAIDVTFASGPGSPPHRTFPLGKGVALGWGPNIHPAMYDAFKDLAERLEIPYKVDILPRMSGTDATALQVVAEGIPTMVISIPLRYMHTPVEMVTMKDVTRAGRLLAEFVSQLDETFMEKLAWS
jgi:tetrahedral aminopeptidase